MSVFATNDLRSEGDSSPTARSKVRTVTELGEIARLARSRGQTVAMCHGVFDLLHVGHIRHIETARKQADMLMVTVTADEFVNKGPGRPIFPELLRAEMLASLAMVDFVAINYAPSAEPAIEQIRPNVYFKGSEYEDPAEDVTGKIETEQAAVERHGGMRWEFY